MGALDMLSGGPDDPDDGSWSSKLGNWGSTAGSLAGGAAGGVAGLGAASIPAGLAGGATGGFLGRQVGKMLGSILDNFSSGNKVSAVKSLAKLIGSSVLPASALAMGVKQLLGQNDDTDEGMLTKMLSMTKDKVPSTYKDELEDTIDVVEDYD